ncbi:MAG: hypothetical protein MUF42_05085 [Cytophagaceae bacterium]|nr:hypothetical protein [Cytophagaceae bacterium]
MQRYTENIDQIENVYRENLKELPVDTDGMWEAFEQNLPPVTPLPPAAPTAPASLSWLPISIGLNVALAGVSLYLYWKVTQLSNTEIPGSTEVPTVTIPDNKEVEALPSPNEKKNVEYHSIEKTTSNSPTATTSNKQSSSVQGAPLESNENVQPNKSTESNTSSEKIPSSEENPVQVGTESNTNQVPKQSVPTEPAPSDDIREHYKDKKGNTKLFK